MRKAAVMQVLAYAKAAVQGEKKSFGPEPKLANPFKAEHWGKAAVGEVLGSQEDLKPTPMVLIGCQAEAALLSQ